MLTGTALDSGWSAPRRRAHAEDGYDLWLRYRPVEAPWAMRYRGFAAEMVAPPGNAVP